MGFLRLERVCFSLKRVRGVTSSELYPAHVCWVFPEFHLKSSRSLADLCLGVSLFFLFTHSAIQPLTRAPKMMIFEQRPDRVKLIF